MCAQVRVLAEQVARKIAAGEVIDRPNSIVRELMDNAIDAGSSRVDLSLEGGGIDRIRLVDNGRGMSGEDLKLCCLPHATSKIETEDDLMSIRSLGFRGGPSPVSPPAAVWKSYPPLKERVISCLSRTAD